MMTGVLPPPVPELPLVRPTPGEDAPPRAVLGPILSHQEPETMCSAVRPKPSSAPCQPVDAAPEERLAPEARPVPSAVGGRATRRHLVLGLAACALSLGLAGQVRADIIFTTFGPGDSYQTGGGWEERGSSFGPGPLRIAFPFTVGGVEDFTFDGARLALSYVGGFNQTPPLRLYADAAGPPGAVLEEIPGSLEQLGPFRDNNPPVVFTSTVHTTLQHGQTYWLLPLAPGDLLFIWNTNDRGLAGTQASSDHEEPTSWRLIPDQTLPAFEVNGSPIVGAAPVPEPSALARSGVGALALLVYARRRRAA